ncbi:MAG: hypothetical protein ACYCQJ_13920 [Nitrososphaerales archaeon]
MTIKDVERVEENVSEAEYAYLDFPTSREYQPEFAKVIIENGSDRNLRYGGTYYIPLEESFAERYTHPGDTKYNFDVVYLREGESRRKNKPSSEYGMTQSIFHNPYELFSIRTVAPGEKVVFFFGEIHDEAGFIHWNVIILNRTNPNLFSVQWFDPAINKEAETNYDFHSREEIISALKKQYNENVFSQIDYRCDETPQYVCATGSIGIDRFCQTWVLLFLDIYVNGLVGKFLHLKFVKYQTQILKYWLLCFLNKHGYWKDMVNTVKIVNSETGKLEPPSFFEEHFPICVTVVGKPVKHPRKNKFELIETEVCTTGNCIEDLIIRFSQ